MWYVAYHAFRCGSVRRQLMHEYVQKSTSTTLPRSCASVSGWRVDPVAVGLERRRDAVVGQPARRRLHGRERLPCRRAPSRAPASPPSVVLDLVLEERRVARACSFARWSSTWKTSPSATAAINDARRRCGRAAACAAMRAAASRPPSAIASIGTAAPTRVGERRSDRADSRSSRARHAVVTAARNGPGARHEDEPERRRRARSRRRAFAGRSREKNASGRSSRARRAARAAPPPSRTAARSRGCAAGPAAARACRGATTRTA